ncbi:MAG: methyltransferase domain-containing protein [Methylococcales bacterium]|nr:methyltransferase domain-containing protein [Methylococcales bacterium]
MKRKFLFSFFETPQGKLLQVQENKYLARSITVSCKQTVLQIGSLGWENTFIDCSLYKRYSIVDVKGKGCNEAVKIRANPFKLPIQTESVDLVLVPHLIEFDLNRFQTMREIERVLKPGGDVVIICFNPLNIYVRMQSVWNKKMSDSWHSYFISRGRMSDWLKILNFEIKTTSEFTIDSIITTPDRFKIGKRTFLSMAFGVKAVKRQYTLIPLTPVKAQPTRLITAAMGVKSTIHRTNDD